MKPVPFRASELSVDCQEFLFACAFWVAAADEKLRAGEHAWLHRQFGSENAERLLSFFLGLQGTGFYEAFDELVRRLADSEKRRVYPWLRVWLVSCIEADGSAAPEEWESVCRVLKRAGAERDVGTGRSDVEEKMPAEPVVSGRASEQGVCLQGHEGEVTAVAVRADGRYMVSGSTDGMIALWQMGETKPSRTLMVDEMGVTDVAFLPDGECVVACGRLGSVVCWRLETGEVVWAEVEKRSGGVSSVGVDWVRACVLTATEVGTLTLRAVTDGAIRARFGLQGCGCLRCIRYSPDGGELLTAGDDRVIRIWNAQSREEVLCLPGHSDGILSLACSPDGRRLVSGGRDNTVRVWDRATGSCVHVLRRHSFNVAGVAFDGRGETIASASWDHSVILWNVADGAVLRSFEFPGVRATCVAFVPGCPSVVVGCSDRTIRIMPVADI